MRCRRRRISRRPCALDNLRRKGFGRLLVGDQAVTLRRRRRRRRSRRLTTLRVVVDRIKVDAGARDAHHRLGRDRLRRRRRRGLGAAAADDAGAARSGTSSPSASSAATCGIPYEDPQPRLFSFNNPFGACPTCHGFGNIIELDLDLVVPDQQKSINQGAIEPWTKPHYRSHLAELKRAAKTARRAPRRAVARPDAGGNRLRVVDGDGEDFEGVRGFFRWLERKKYKVHVRVFLSRYRGYLTCPDCGGTRLRREARDVQVGGVTIDKASARTVREAREVLRGAGAHRRRKRRSPTRC